MNRTELKQYIDSMIAQKDKIRKNIFQLCIYSNGSITLEDMFNIPTSDLPEIEKIITEKIKLDKGIKEKQML